jgi:hypothetical protein
MEAARSEALSVEPVRCPPSSTLCVADGVTPSGTRRLSDAALERRGLLLSFAAVEGGYPGTLRLSLRRTSDVGPSARLLVDLLSIPPTGPGKSTLTSAASVLASGAVALGDLPCTSLPGLDAGACLGADTVRDVALVAKAKGRVAPGAVLGVWLHVEADAPCAIEVGTYESSDRASLYETVATRTAAGKHWAAAAPLVVSGPVPLMALQFDPVPTPTCKDGVRNGREADIDCGPGCATCALAKSCRGDADCASATCVSGRCRASTCRNGVKGGGETGVDCGGSCAPCGDGAGCTRGTDCGSNVCTASKCAVASCSDGILNGAETALDCGGDCPACVAPACDDGRKNGDETAIDCGGSCPLRCAVSELCAKGADCDSGVCSGGKCVAAKCADRTRNGDESGMDCGGSCPKKCPNGGSCGVDGDCLSGSRCHSGTCEPKTCATVCGASCVVKCAVGAACATANDCESANCTAKKCGTATCFNGVKDGGEGGVDCGGPCARRCLSGEACKVGGDCLAGVCTGSKCATPSCSDGVRNGLESSADTGGACARTGADAAVCARDSDCGSGRCVEGACAAPTADDRVRNGAESDVDCGGGSAPACVSGRRCTSGADCVSGACGGGFCTSGPSTPCPLGAVRDVAGACRPVEVCASSDAGCARVRVLPEVIAPEPERFGTNIGNIDMNNWTTDPAMEGVVIRYRFEATGGDERRIWGESGATTDAWETIGDHFFDGAHVRVYRDDIVTGSTSLVREGTVEHYLATKGVALRVDLDADGPVVQAGDFVFVEMVVDDGPHDRVNPRMKGLSGGYGPWSAFGTVTWVTDPTTSAPVEGGRSSLRLTSAAAGEGGIKHYAYWSPEIFFETLVEGRTYTVSLWMKQEGIPSGKATFALDSVYSAVRRTFDVTGEWRRYTFDFVATRPPKASEPTAQNKLFFEGPGTLWVDGFVLHEASEPPLAPTKLAVDALKSFRPGVVRLWSGHANTRWGSTVDTWTSSEWTTQRQWDTNWGAGTGEKFKLPVALPVVRDTGATPWLIVGPFFDEQEWLDLMDYLAGDETTEYGRRRIAQGQVKPWTTVFPKIRLEFGNEAWNTMFFPWADWNGGRYGRMAEHFFQVARSSPFFDPEVFEFIVNGWIISDTPTGFGAQAKRASPSADYVDITAYTGGWELGGTVGGESLTDEGFWNTLVYLPAGYGPWYDQQEATRRTLAAEGHPYRLAVYEAGPSYGLPNPGSPFNLVQEKYGKSLANGMTTLDCFLYGALKGVGPQNFFLFQGSANWASHTPTSSGFRPHTAWQTLSMRNRHASGDMVATELLQAPGRVTDVRGVPTRVPLVSSYAFRDGDRWTFFLLSRHLDQTMPVVVELPFATASKATMHLLSGGARGARATNIDSMEVTERAIDLGPAGSSVNVALPPAGVAAIVFEGAADVLQSPVRRVTLGLAPGQAASTSEPVVRFQLAYDRVGTPLAAENLIVSGTAVDASSALALTTADDGLTQVATVSGLVKTGDVHLAVSSTDVVEVLADTVRYRVPAPRDRLFAWDDFTPSKNAVPFYLNGSTSGAGWKGGWEEQSHDPAKYASGLLQKPTGTWPALTRTGLGASGGPFLLGRPDLYSGNRRQLSTDAFPGLTSADTSGPFVGLSGRSLWASVLVRKGADDDAPLFFNFGRGTFPYWIEQSFGAGFIDASFKVGGQRRWGIRVRKDSPYIWDSNIKVVSPRPVVAGRTTLLVVRVDFAARDTVSLWVDPPLATGGDGGPLVPPDATATTDADLGIRSVMVVAGAMNPTTAPKSQADELRLGDSFTAVTTLKR